MSVYENVFDNYFNEIEKNSIEKSEDIEKAKKGISLTYTHKKKISEALKKRLRMSTDELFKDYLDNHKGEIYKLANKFNDYFGTKQELVQEGLTHLYENIAKYNPKKSQFNTWAHHVLKNHFFWMCRPSELNSNEYRQLCLIKEAKRTLFNSLKREPTIDELKKVVKIKPDRIEYLLQAGRKVDSLDKTIYNDIIMLGDTIAIESTVEDEFEQSDLQDTINKTLLKLDDRDSFIVANYFGYNKQKTSMTLEEIGKKIKMSKVGVKKALDRSLEKMKTELKALGFEKSFIDEEKQNYDIYITNKTLQYIENIQKEVNKKENQEEIKEMMEKINKALILKSQKIENAPILKSEKKEYKPFIRIRQRKPEILKNLRTVTLSKSLCIKAVIGDLPGDKVGIQTLLFNQDDSFGKSWNLKEAKDWYTGNKQKIKTSIDINDLIEKCKQNIENRSK